MINAQHIGNNMFIGFTDIAGFRFTSGPVNGDPIVAARAVEAIVAEFKHVSPVGVGSEPVGLDSESDALCHAE